MLQMFISILIYIYFYDLAIVNTLSHMFILIFDINVRQNKLNQKA